MIILNEFEDFGTEKDVKSLDPKPVKIKKEKQPKQKKTADQKRIIASQIALGCMCAMVISALPGMLVRNGYDKDIRELNNDQNAIYEQFMASEEFSDSFKAEFTKISNDYANGIISYEEFDEKVQHLNSVKYAQEVLASSNNTELKSQVEEIDKQKQERSDEFGSSIITNLTLGSMLAFGTASMISTIATGVYGTKEVKEEERKKKLLTNTPNSAVAIKSKNHYTSVDRLVVDENPAEKQENNPSCNENCLGIRYYDSNTMTIRNTNGKDEENEQNLNQ